jgi:hypothetical protein
MVNIKKRREYRKFILFKDPDGFKEDPNELMDIIDFYIFAKNWDSPFEYKNREMYLKAYLYSGHS